MYGSSGCFMTLPTFGGVSLSNSSHSNGCLQIHLICISLMLIMLGTFSQAFWPFLYLLLGRHLFRSFAHFLPLRCLDFVMLLAFLLQSWKSSFIYSGYQSFVKIHVLQTLFQNREKLLSEPESHEQNYCHFYALHYYISASLFLMFSVCHSKLIIYASE